ncbi:MAG: M20/M25/M40 family metallo-hydrolase, partial [Deinococcota bacterium]
MSIQLSAEALLTRDLISCHTPSGRERAAADCLVQAFQTLNYDDAYIDAAGNAVGILHCGDSPETGPTVMLNGHIDTVALGDESLWAHPPLSGAVSDEDGSSQKGGGPRMWGRGACDMKAAVACMAYAAKDAADAGFNGTLIVTGVVQEEVGGFGARYLATEQQADVVILGEPSKLKLMVGHRGRLEVHAHIQGKIAHAASNNLGLNALYEAAEVLKTLEILELPTGGRLHGSSLTPTNLASSPDSHNVVPGEARLVIDYRNIP